jgi:hypothetical protein
MKKIVLGFLAVTLFLPFPALAKSKAPRPRHSKPTLISGRVSENGKTLTAKNGESWAITNPDVVAGHESQQVKVKCQVSSGSHDIRVLSVKTVATPISYRPNPSDSAFRR